MHSNDTWWCGRDAFLSVLWFDYRMAVLTGMVMELTRGMAFSEKKRTTSVRLVLIGEALARGRRQCVVVAADCSGNWELTFWSAGCRRADRASWRETIILVKYVNERLNNGS